MAKIARVLIPLDSQDRAAWDYALAYATSIGGGVQPAVRDYVLLTHAKTQLKDTVLNSHVGAAVARTLLGNRSAMLPGGGQLRHATLQTLRGSARGAVVLAYFAEDRMLQMLDGIDGVVAVVAVPGHPGEAQGWIERWNPHVHGQAPSAPKVLIEDPVVVNALAALSGSVNRSHAVMNPLDKSHADETLRILRAKGHDLEPKAIESWAIQNGWKPGAARELSTLAGKIGALASRPTLGKFQNVTGRYESWCK